MNAVTAYFAAINARDFASAAACFAPDARVHDESRDYVGQGEIRVWIEETTRKYDHHLAPGTITPRDGKNIVTTLVTGNFPGSPVELDFVFTVTGEGISSLEIS